MTPQNQHIISETERLPNFDIRGRYRDPLYELVDCDAISERIVLHNIYELLSWKFGRTKPNSIIISIAWHPNNRKPPVASWLHSAMSAPLKG